MAAALTADLSGAVAVTVAAPDTTALVPTAELLRRYHPETTEAEWRSWESTPGAPDRITEPASG